MSIFKNYSDYYDLLYKDKDYNREASRIQQLIVQHAPQAKTVLNLGCGTGNHDFILSDFGYEVSGVDISPEMIERAVAKLSIKKDKKLSFQVGDIRTVRLERTFDVVISLFHVLSYQTSNKDLEAAFITASTHLAPGGVFIFDCWYGPGVLTELPATRYKVLENEKLIVHRVAEPFMRYSENVCDVNYTMLVENKEKHSIYQVKETHPMRYLFDPELEMIGRSNQLAVKYARDWYGEKEQLSNKDWQALFVMKKQA